MVGFHSYQEKTRLTSDSFGQRRSEQTSNVLVVLDRLGSGLGHFGHNCRALAEGSGLERQRCVEEGVKGAVAEKREMR